MKRRIMCSMASGRGEEELVGLVVSAGQGASGVVGVLVGCLVRILGGAADGGFPVRSPRCRGVGMAGWDWLTPGDGRCHAKCKVDMTRCNVGLSGWCSPCVGEQSLIVSPARLAPAGPPPSRIR